MRNRPIYVFDIDGTLTSSWYEEDRVHELDPHPPMVDLAITLGKVADIAIVTARPHFLLDPSHAWLQKHGIEYFHLGIRPQHDDRDDHFLRVDQVREVERKFGQVEMVFDDREQNCHALRDAGYHVVRVIQNVTQY